MFFIYTPVFRVCFVSKKRTNCLLSAPVAMRCYTISFWGMPMSVVKLFGNEHRSYI